MSVGGPRTGPGQGQGRARAQGPSESGPRIARMVLAHIFGHFRPGQGQEEWSEMLITMAGTDSGPSESGPKC
jgi:hypothetical protein